MMKLNILILCTAGCSAVQEAIWPQPDDDYTIVTSDTWHTASTDTGNWWTYTTTGDSEPLLEIHNESHVSTEYFCIAYAGQKYNCESMVLLPGYYNTWTIYEPGCYDFKVLAWDEYGWEFPDVCLDYGETVALHLQ
jgi:hypothetical protein